MILTLLFVLLCFLKVFANGEYWFCHRNRMTPVGWFCGQSVERVTSKGGRDSHWVWGPHVTTFSIWAGCGPATVALGLTRVGGGEGGWWAGGDRPQLCCTRSLWEGHGEQVLQVWGWVPEVGGNHIGRPAGGQQETADLLSWAAGPTTEYSRVQSSELAG